MAISNSKLLVYPEGNFGWAAKAMLLGSIVSWKQPASASRQGLLQSISKRSLGDPNAGHTDPEIAGFWAWFFVRHKNTRGRVEALWIIIRRTAFIERTHDQSWPFVFFYFWAGHSWGFAEFLWLWAPRNFLWEKPINIICLSNKLFSQFMCWCRCLLFSIAPDQHHQSPRFHSGNIFASGFSDFYAEELPLRGLKADVFLLLWLCLGPFFAPNLWKMLGFEYHISSGKLALVLKFTIF